MNNKHIIAVNIAVMTTAAIMATRLFPMFPTVYKLSSVCWDWIALFEVGCWAYISSVKDCILELVIV